MTEKEQRAAAKEFAENWKGKGYEKGESQSFWIDLLHLGQDCPYCFFDNQSL